MSRAARRARDEHERRYAAVPRRVGVLHPGAQGAVEPEERAARQPVRDGRDGHRDPHDPRADRQAGRVARREPAARPRARARRADRRRRCRGIRRRARRDDEDAGTRRGDALADRSRGRVHRVCGGVGAGSVRARAAGRGVVELHPVRQPRRAVHRHVRRRDHVLRVGDRVRQAVGQVQVPAVSGRAGRVCRPAPDQPDARDRDARLRHPVLHHAGVAAVHHHDGDRVRARRADHHPDRRCGHAGGRVDAELVLGLGRGRHRLLAEQRDADHRRLAGRLVGCDPVVHHVPRDEPLVLQRDPRRVRRGSRGRRRGGRAGAAAGEVGFGRRCGVHARQCGIGRDRAGLRACRRPRAARAEGADRQAGREGHRREVRDPPGRGADAGPHERAARGSGSAVRDRARDGGHQRRIRPGGRGARARRERRRESGREERSEIADRGDADHRGVQGAHGDRQQALDGGRLRGPRQRPVLHGQDDDGVRRCEGKVIEDMVKAVE
ncbi:NAD/NADP transhydrogenase beta subunit [Burkholderia cenocepacia PC184]|nr:NAD/NADP transhydrogenase beta subunit [Burkholderia cenocepacia PC184]